MSTLDFIASMNGEGKLPTQIPEVTRHTLAKWLKVLDFKVGVEVGVAEGRYSEILAYENPQMKLYGVDPYIPYSGYKDYVRQSTFNELENNAKERLSKYSNYEFIKDFSVEAAKRFEDGSLDFVYLDGNHTFKYVLEDLELWYPKVKSGGILAGHDFARIRAKDGKPSQWEVKQALAKFTKDYKIDPWFVLGLEDKDRDKIRENIRSWFIVKQ